MKKVLLAVVSAALLLSMAACGEGTTSAPSKAESTIVINPTNPESSLPSETSSVSSALENLGIAGSHYNDVRLNLEKRGFEKRDLSNNRETGLKSYTNMMKDETGTSYDVSISIVDHGEISGIVFGVNNDSTLDNETFLKQAENYLNFCVSVPYDSSDTTKAQSWLKEHLSSATDNPTTTTIGDAVFELSGTNMSGVATSRILRISKAN